MRNYLLVFISAVFIFTVLGHSSCFAQTGIGAGFNNLKGIKLKNKQASGSERPAKTDGAETSPARSESVIPRVVQLTRQASEDSLKSKDICARVEANTWKLLAGEVFLQEQSTLFSDTVDALTSGLQELDALEGEIESNEENLKQLFREPELAARYDLARQRREKLQQSQSVARNEELDRVHQQRLMLLEYYRLTSRLSQVQLYLQVGQFDKANAALESFSKCVENLQNIVASRPDYFLYKDEPELLSAQDNPETFNISHIQTAPLGMDLLTHIYAVHALALYQEGVKNGETSANLVLINESIQYANKALDTQSASMPEAAPDTQDSEVESPKNVLSYYVLSLCHLAKGLTITSENSASMELHQKAKSDFDLARQNLSFASKTLLGISSDLELKTRLNRGIEKIRLSLDSPDLFLKQAQLKTEKGDAAGALQILSQAALVYPLKEVWRPLLDASRRAGGDINQQLSLIKQARNILDEKDLPDQIVLSMACLDGVEQAYAANNLELIKAFSSDLTVFKELLTNSSLTVQSNSSQQAIVQSILAYSLYWEDILQPDSEKAQARGTQMALLAKSARALFQKNQTKTDISVCEYKIYACLAYGRAALRWLSDSRDDGFLAYMEANNLQSKLPFTGSYKQKKLGDPLLTALANRQDGSFQKLVAEERKYRILMEQYIRGAFSLGFGDCDGAAKQMDTAYKNFLSSDGTVSPESATSNRQGAGISNVAEERLDQEDGFGGVLRVEESIRVFSILADISANKGQEALTKILQFLAPGSAPDETGIRLALDNSNSAFTTFALAKALDCCNQQSGYYLTKEKEVLRSYCLKAYQKAGRQLESILEAQQYPSLPELVAEGKMRYENDKILCEQFTQKKVAGASMEVLIDVAKQGLAFQPKSVFLWNQYFDCCILLSEQNKDQSSVLLKKLADEITAVQSLDVLTPYTLQYYNGVINELLSNHEEAIACYEAAEKKAVGKDKLLVQSRLGMLRLKMGI